MQLYSHNFFGYKYFIWLLKAIIALKLKQVIEKDSGKEID